MELNITYDDGIKNISLYTNSDETEFMLDVNGTKETFTNKNEALTRFRISCGICL